MGRQGGEADGPHPATGRGVLVTGGAGGIGRAVAAAFAGNGDRVAVHYHSSEERAARVLEGLPGEGHVTVRGDLTDAEAVRRVVDGAAEALGRLDVLVNNAGIWVRHPIAEVSYEEWREAWRRTIDTNLVAAANATYWAVRHMMRRGSGRVVNVSSRGAFRGEPEHPAYGATKAALNAFGQSLARALAPHGIAVLTVAPGYVETAMAEKDLEGERGAEIRAQSPFERVAFPEEVAAAVLYLASPLAEFASGAILDLNGASYLRT